MSTAPVNNGSGPTLAAAQALRDSATNTGALKTVGNTENDSTLKDAVSSYLQKANMDRTLAPLALLNKFTEALMKASS